MSPIVTPDHIDAIDVALSEARVYQTQYEAAAVGSAACGRIEDSHENDSIAAHYRSIATRLSETQGFLRRLVSGELATYPTATHFVGSHEDARAIQRVIRESLGERFAEAVPPGSYDFCDDVHALTKQADETLSRWLTPDHDTR